MPVVSRFYGITVSLYFLDNRRHHRPHIHVKYQNDEAAVAIPGGEVLEGSTVLNALTQRDPQTNPDFAGDLIHNITIIEDDASS